MHPARGQYLIYLTRRDGRLSWPSCNILLIHKTDLIAYCLNYCK